MADIGSTNGPKSFWSKPEGITGMLFIGAIGATILYFWGKIVPFLVKMMSDTLHLAMLAAIAGAIVYVVMDPNIRTGFWYLFKMTCRAFTSIVVNIDPIVILKTYIRDLKDKRQEASEKIDEVAGVEEKLKANIQKNAAEIKKSQDLYARGVKEGRSSEELAVYTIRAGGLKELNDSLVIRHTQMVKVKAFLEKMHKSSGYLIQQMEVQVEIKEQEYTAIKAANKAMKSALSIFKGDPNKKELFDMAIERIADDMALKVGEMKRAMNMSTDFLNEIDLEQGVASENGLKIIENIDASKFTLLTVDDVNKSSSKNLVPEYVQSAGPSSNKYGNL